MVNKWYLVLFLVFACGGTWAEMREVVPGSANGASVTPPPGSSSFGLRRLPFDFLAGASNLKGITGIALAVRGPLANKVRWEVGGVLPHPVSGYSNDAAASVVPPLTETDSARVRKYGETHGVVLYPLFSTPRASGRPGFTLDAGAGLSLGFINNEIVHLTTGGAIPLLSDDNENEVRLSPRLQLGVAAALTDHISVRLDAAWVHYANEDSAGVHTFNLGFSGIMINPMLQVRI